MQKPDLIIDEIANNEREIKIIRFKQLNTLVKKKQIVFAGSSLAEQFPVNEMLMSLEKNMIVYNRGIGGDTTLDLMRDIESCIFDLEPRKLFINIGTNDIGNANYHEDTLLLNYKMILTQIRNRLPDTEVYLLSYYPVNPEKECDMSDEDKAQMFATRTNISIKSANKRVEEVAKEFSYEYVNVSAPLFGENSTLNEKYTVEGVHLWPIAYQKVLEILLPYME